MLHIFFFLAGKNMTADIGCVVEIAFTDKGNESTSRVLGVIEKISAEHSTFSVFVGTPERWTVPVSSARVVSLPQGLRWTAEMTGDVMAQTSKKPTAAERRGFRSEAAEMEEGELIPEAQVQSQSSSFVTTPTAMGLTRSVPLSLSGRTVRRLCTVPSVDESSPKTYLRLRDGLAALEGLCQWQSPCLTIFFFSTLYCWLYFETFCLSLEWESTGIVSRLGIGLLRFFFTFLVFSCIVSTPQKMPSTSTLIAVVLVAATGGLISTFYWSCVAVAALTLTSFIYLVQGIWPHRNRLLRRHSLYSP